MVAYGMQNADKEQAVSVQRSGSPARWLGTMLRLAARHPGCAILLFAVLIGVAGRTLLLAGVSTPSAGIVMVSQIVLLALSPTLLFGPAGRRRARHAAAALDPAHSGGRGSDASSRSEGVGAR
jgi:hypothetical protein